MTIKKTTTPRLRARAFCPATVANVAAGFDILGYCLADIGDTVTVERTARIGVEITSIESSQDLPYDPLRNTASVALLALSEGLGLDFGFKIRIEKKIPLSSGMGGSAASCVAALVAANALLPCPLSPVELYPYALKGEYVASGSCHGDNVGPALLGGLVVTTPNDLIPLSVPMHWHNLLVHPHAQLETRKARAVLKDPFDVSQIVAQNACLAQLLVGCLRADSTLVAKGLKDVLIEPRRAALIPGFKQAKNAALAANALGAGIAGAGPSLFAWFAHREQAQVAAVRVQEAFACEGMKSQYWLHPIMNPGACLIAVD